MSERKAVIKNADMERTVQDDAVYVASAAMDKYDIEKDVAAYIKKEFDRKYTPNWHCIVGKHFGSMIEHKAVIRNTDMSTKMQEDAIDVASDALDKYELEMHIAEYVKKEFDIKYNPLWHCIVGRNFGRLAVKGFNFLFDNNYYCIV
ncbi:unnamed protein product [Schistosoma margrebowiei]|uniref:Dynein light chain n=1 Tax=Schistosoma margrebowiei TaxID=48269 RepID=A0A183MLM7_9TREM|nr:unnamed protein product [Schistosoma margrebowiei]